jgi:hypothetical protein
MKYCGVTGVALSGQWKREYKWGICSALLIWGAEYSRPSARPESACALYCGAYFGDLCVLLVILSLNF